MKKTVTVTLTMAQAKALQAAAEALGRGDWEIAGIRSAGAVRRLAIFRASERLYLAVHKAGGWKRRDP